jgi:acyl carrier protein
MGLDIVELVMRVEEEFDVDIPDKVQETILTVGDLADAVAAELTRLGRPADPNDIFGRVKKLTVERAEVKPEKVTRDAKFVDDLGMD